MKRKLTKSGEAEPREVVDWVFNNMGVTPTKSSAPSPGAYQWLLLINGDDDAKKEFLRIWSKLLPTKTEIEREAKMRDKGDKAIELLAKYRKGLKEMGVE